MAKSVVVTGANSGIGRSTALELAGAGYEVFGTVRNEEKAAGLQEAAAAKKVTLRTVVCDVSNADSCAEGFSAIAAATDGGPWAVVNNAGFAQPGAVEDVSDELARAQLEINLVAPARVAKLVLPHMREVGDGRIVNISSIAGRVSSPFTGWYSASKHGLEALSDALRVEVAGFGVKVVLIEPGGFGTDIWSGGADVLPDPDHTAYAAAYQRAQQVTAKGGSLPDPVWVARAIRLALAVPAPLPRYLVGFDAMGGLLAQTLTPTIVQDYVKGLASGLRKLPFIG